MTIFGHAAIVGNLFTKIMPEVIAQNVARKWTEVNRMGSVLTLFSILSAFTIGYMTFRFVDVMIGKLEGSVSRETGRDVV